MEETKRRGRPPRDPNEEQIVSTITITDPSIEPFYILKDASNFTVIEKYIASRGFGGSKSTGKEQEKILGYYTSLTNALRVISKEKFGKKNKTQYHSIKEYISDYREIYEGLQSIFNSIEI
jgi:hypothetical protein